MQFASLSIYNRYTSCSQTSNIKQMFDEFPAEPFSEIYFSPERKFPSRSPRHHPRPFHSYAHANIFHHSSIISSPSFFLNRPRDDYMKKIFLHVTCNYAIRNHLCSSPSRLSRIELPPPWENRDVEMIPSKHFSVMVIRPEIKGNESERFGPIKNIPWLYY